MYFFFTIPFWVIVLAALVVFSAGSFVAGIMAVALPYFTAAVTIIWLVVLVLVLHGERKRICGCTAYRNGCCQRRLL